MARKTHSKRRAFTVGDQLLDKLGPGAYGALLDQMFSRTRKPAPPRRRRRPRRKAVA